MITWRIDAQAAAGDSDDMALPLWIDGAPYCDVSCPHRTTVSCKLTGLLTGRLCEPVVKQMAVLLSAGPVKP